MNLSLVQTFADMAAGLSYLALPLIALLVLPSGGTWRFGIGKQVVFGIVSGLAATLAMTSPIVFSPGVFVDGRTVAIGLAGFIGGPIAAIAATVLAGAFRLAEGGAGAVAGTAALVVAAAIGAIFHRAMRDNGPEPTLEHLALLGVSLFLGTFAAFAMIPHPQFLAFAARELALPMAVLIPGATVLIGAVYLNVARQYRLRERLASSEHILNSVATHIPGFVYQRIVEPDGTMRYTYVSEGAERFWGFDPREVLHDPALAFETIHPDDRERFHETVREATRSVAPWQLDLRTVARDGTEHWIRVAANPTRLASGAVLWDAMGIDTTDIKLAQDETDSARARAEDANRAKSNFLANMSHELRTPLNAIIGFTDLMTHEIYGRLGSPKYGEYVRDIKSSAGLLLDLINDLLDLSKAEAGRLELNEENFVVRDVVVEAIRLVEQRVEGGDVDLRFGGVDMAATLCADRRKTLQMILNLLTNAAKFSPRGSTIRITALSRSDGRFAVAVADQGRGMTAEEIAVALEPFGQVQRPSECPAEGTGLGLPLTRQLVELHGGTLDLDSVPGHGTRATLLFPAERVAVRRADAA